MIDSDGNVVYRSESGDLGGSLDDESSIGSMGSSSFVLQEKQEVLHMDNDKVELVTTMSLAKPISTLDESSNSTGYTISSSFLPPVEVAGNDNGNEYDSSQNRFDTGSISKSNRALQQPSISLLSSSSPSSTPIQMLSTPTAAPSIGPDNTIDLTETRNTEGEVDPTMSPSSLGDGSEDDLVTSTDTDIIRETLRLYGSFYLLCFTIFCFARKRYPRLYNIRSWVPDLHCNLATESIVANDHNRGPKKTNPNSTEEDDDDDDSVQQSSPQKPGNSDEDDRNDSSSSSARVKDEEGLIYGISGSGYIKWMKNIYMVTDNEMLQQCGLDATCFLRCLRLGWNLSLFGIFISLWLIPIFLTAETSPDTEYLTDMFVISSVANIPSGSQRFLAVVVAAYLITFYALHMITREYDWYISMRHKFLSQRYIRNYSIYVSGIPPEFRSSFALRDYFQNCSWNSAVVDCHIAMDIPKLEAKVAKRDKVVKKLEHVIALEKRHGVTQTHRKFLLPSYASKRFLPRWFRKASNKATRQRIFSDGSYDFEMDRHGNGQNNNFGDIISTRVTEKVDTVEEYEKELKQLNQEISLAIGKTQRMNDRRRRNLSRSSASSNVLSPRSTSSNSTSSLRASRNLLGGIGGSVTLQPLDDDDDDIPDQDKIGTSLSPIKEVNSTSPTTSPSSAVSSPSAGGNNKTCETATTSVRTLETAGVSTSTLGQLTPIMEDIDSHHNDVQVNNPKFHTPRNNAIDVEEGVNSNGDNVENEHADDASFQQDVDTSPHPFLQLLGLDPFLSPQIQRHGATSIATTGESTNTPMDDDDDDAAILHRVRSTEDEADEEEVEDPDSEGEVEISFFREDSDDNNDDDSLLDYVTNSSGNDNSDIENGLPDSRKMLTISQAASGSTLGSGSYATDDSLTSGGRRKTKRSWRRRNRMDGDPSTNVLGYRVSSGRRLLGDAAGQVTGGVKRVGAKGVKVGKLVAETGVGGVMNVGAKGVKVGKLVAETGVTGVKRVAESSVGKGVMRVAESGVNQLRTPDSFVGATLAAGGSLVAESAALVAPMLRNSEDGLPRDAGFVVFRDLYTTQAARQMLQHHVPGHMTIDAAPSPDDVIWRNVGLSEKALRSGRLLSLAASITLALFWSIVSVPAYPVPFIIFVFSHWVPFCLFLLISQPYAANGILVIPN